jgi:Uma2 family endonuclease
MSVASTLTSAAVSPVIIPRAPRVLIEEKVCIPSEVIDLDSFCRWACSDQFPQRGRFSFLRGTIWVDLSMEVLYTHNQVKEAIGRVLGGLVTNAQLGRFMPDGMLLRNSAADLSTEPDGMFVSYEAMRSGRVQRVQGAADQDFLELEGTPEMVLEVVSATSVQKDTVELRELYWKADIAEYWLVDVREGNLDFNLLKHGSKDYTVTRRQAGGWLKSTVFNRSFRLTQQMDPLGEPLYQLDVR